MNDGTKVSKVNGSYVLPNMKKEEYTFTGWYTDNTCETAVGNHTVFSVENNIITLYIKWTELKKGDDPVKEDESYKEGLGILISLGGDTYYEKYNLDTKAMRLHTGDMVSEESGAIKLPALTKEGYEFIGWYVDNTCETLVTDSKLIEAHGDILVIYAKWIKKPEEVESGNKTPKAGEFKEVATGVFAETISINANTHTMHDGTSVPMKNGAHLLPITRDKEGYTFKGWYIDSQLNKLVDDNTVFAVIDGYMYVYAKWIVTEEPPHNDDGDSEDSTGSKDTTSENGQVNSAVTSERMVLDTKTNTLSNGTKFTVDKDGNITLPALTKEGYIFGGWYLDAACSESISNGLHIENNQAVVYVKWIQKKSVEVPKTEEETTGTEAVTKEEPTPAEDSKTDAKAEETTAGTIKKPAKVKISKVAKGKKKATVYYKKVKGCKYKIQISTKKNMKNAKTYYTKATKYTIKKLKSKKTYYIRLCAYKTVNGKKVCGKWSAVKKVKVK